MTSLPWWSELGACVRRAAGSVPRSIVAVPTGFVGLVERVGAWSSEGVMVMVGDEGVFDMTECDVVQSPLVQRNGHVRIPLNVVVLSEWVRAHGGFALTSESHDRFRVGGECWHER